MGASVTVYSLLFGLIVGSLASYYKNLRIVLMRLVDVLMSFPSILLALALMAIFGRGSFFSVVLSVGTVHAPRAARIVFGSALSILEEEYIAAAHALGASDWHIITRHVLRNLVSPVIVQGSYIFAVSIVEVAALDFLGVGMPPYIASWGGMMNEGRIYITSAPWIIGFPGLFLAVTVLAVNLLGDALRDVLDPRLRGLL
jgi:peptide/nickel transport system permease protein